jgi:hypothetical protein
MDETTTDVAPQEAGESLPSETSQPKAETRSPGTESQLEVALKELGELKGQVRALQSEKDKGIAKVSKQFKELSEELKQYEEWKTRGKTPEEAQREMLIDQILKEYQGSPESTEVPQPATVASPDYLSPVLEMAGLKSDDPEVVEILRKENNPAVLIGEIKKLSENRKQAPPKAPAPGAAMSTGAGTAIESESLESITAELQAEIAKPATPATRARIKELRKKHEALLPKK